MATFYILTFVMAVCRVCLSIDNSLESLFIEQRAQMMQTCANVSVYEGDNLPDQICAECVLNLNIAFQFKTKCESSYETLIKAHNQIKQETDNLTQELPQSSDMKYETEEINQSYVMNTGGIKSPKNYLKSPKKMKIDIKKYGYFIVANQDDMGLEPEYLEALYKTYKHKCSHCPRIYAVATHFKVHINGHLGIRPYFCKLCQKNFPDERSHIKYHKQRKEKGAYKCEFCERSYNCASSLRTHIKVHTGDLKWFHCTLCSKKFNQLNKLNNHTVVHTNERNFVCQYCSKAFRFNRNLKAHIASVHVKDKSYMCDSCSKGFATSHELTLHKRRHLGIKNHKCRMCSLCFVSSSEAQSHMLSVHMKNKNYACRICGVKFSRSTHRNNHEQSKRCVIKMVKNPLDNEETLNNQNSLLKIEEKVLPLL